ncbi:TetR family transcriptional regulator [Clostridium sp. MCC353]|uniref:TetR/AcrR family transcriptional regulator n=1 Tax=Clostridium sp. MCC353 TaxID=2592646 RepID=UPI001C01EF47|nr:TetR/AcrR family transcriptional regulator [Clostridium sp. MCC353]MBT9779763.1 TetR family transcriptional regulator [Clostridium sp. MCC353]
MARKGLTEDIIIETSARLIAENGYQNFSLHGLAAELGIKTASLYNHIPNSKKLVAKVGERVLHNLKQSIRDATEGKMGLDAVEALAAAYRRFALENPELYQLILLIPELDDDDFSNAGRTLMADLYGKLSPFCPSREEQVHAGRMLRSCMHGFISLEHAGFFRSSVEIEDSYRYVIHSFIQMLESK